MMGYKLEQVEAIAAKLRELPAIEPPPKDLSKKEAVKLLSKEIRSLQKRGYTLEQIASSLKGEGLDISSYTLKSYMNNSKQGSKLKAATPAQLQAAKSDKPKQTDGSDSEGKTGDETLHSSNRAEGNVDVAEGNVDVEVQQVEKQVKDKPQPKKTDTSYTNKSKLVPRADSTDL
ncbi:hypothetical protein [Chamaesiphon polymorphus]|uniref:hypothetical protein n=1 Tax=Chamaesiphon polymorphus TaxID=2107691 RepID=UPI0015E72BE5|nr:hypothetical protein [Chamaesiphon polymorphus]